MSDLNALLLAAHAADDRSALVDLYEQAADQATDLDAACFYLTHAFIFGLEVNHPKTQTLRDRLIGYGRELPL